MMTPSLRRPGFSHQVATKARNLAGAAEELTAVGSSVGENARMAAGLNQLFGQFH